MAVYTEDELFDIALHQLALHGYTLAQEETGSLLFAVKRAHTFVRNFCHVDEITDGMEYATADIAAAYFLEPLVSSGAFGRQAGTSQEVSSIMVGDTTTTFQTSGSSPTAMILSTVQSLLDGGKRELCRFRKLLF